MNNRYNKVRLYICCVSVCVCAYTFVLSMGESIARSIPVSRDKNCFLYQIPMVRAQDYANVAYPPML